MKIIFDLLTSPLGLPMNPVIEYFILFVVGTISCKIAYKKVGFISKDFSTKNAGIMSLLHWSIRFICFVLIWAVLYAICYAIKFIVNLF